MTNKEIEDAIAKALLNGDGQLIPVDQVGGDPSNYTVNEADWAQTQYEMYYDSCHSSNSLESSWTREKYCPVNMLKPNRFACYGQKGHFQWFAMSVYYDASLHKMTPDKEAYNKHHKSAVCGGGYGNCENLCQAINEMDSIVYMMNNPLLVDTSDIEEVYDLRLIMLDGCLGRFLDTGGGVSAYTKRNGVYVADSSKVKGKDLLLPFIYATNNSLKIYGELAKSAINAGANTVTGIFATRIKPTVDGRECNSIPREYEVHEFAPRFSLNFGDLL